MPCSDCDHTLLYDQEKERLYCPACHDLPVVNKELGIEAASSIQEEYLNNQELIRLLGEFGSFRVIAELLHQLNGGAYGMTNENRMQFKQFFTATPLVKSVYGNWEEFDHNFNPENDVQQDEVKDHVETLLEGGALLIPVLNQIQEEFAVVRELTPVQSDWNEFYANNEFLHTEYWLCSERCKRATVGAREEIRDQFLEQQRIFRTFTKPDKDDVETVQEFGDAWYGLIASMGFSATLQRSLQEAFTTDFPDFVTIYDIEELIENVDQAVSKQLKSRREGEYQPFSLNESTFDACGERVFGEDWSDVKEAILVTPSNPDAHPMFFKYSGTRDKKLQGWRQARRIPFNKVLYPDLFTYLLKFQIYPLLENGDSDASREILGDLTAKRGLEFERHVFEYLKDQDIEAYYSCKTAKRNGNEVDVIFVRDGTLFFVEAKFVLPTLSMNTQTGVRDVNETFNEKIFIEGKPFDEKVGTWVDLDPGFEFTHEKISGENDRVSKEIPAEWDELDTEMLVVSNFVPSYLEKRGVRFLTDLELHQWIEYGEDVFIDVMTPPHFY